MTRKTVKTWLTLAVVGGIPLTTSVTCDPNTGVFDFYRVDDDYDDCYYDDCYVDVWYDDCFFDCF